MVNEIENEIRTFFEILNKVLDSQQGYFKLMITLNTGVILITIGLLEKIFRNPEWLVILLLSILGFVVSLFFALFMLTLISGMIATSIDFFNYFMAIQMHSKDATEEEKLQEAASRQKKQIDAKLQSLGRRGNIYFNICNYSFMAGVILLLVFSAINFVNQPSGYVR